MIYFSVFLYHVVWNDYKLWQKELWRSLVQLKSPSCYSDLSYTICTQLRLLWFASRLPSRTPELTCYFILLSAAGVTGHWQLPDTTVGRVRGKTLFVCTIEQPCSYCAFLTIPVRKLLRSCSSEQQRAGEWKAMAIGDARPDEKEKAFPHEDSPTMQEGPGEVVPFPSLEFCQPNRIKSPEIPGLTSWLSLVRAGVRLESSRVPGRPHESVVFSHVSRVSSDTLLCFHHTRMCVCSCWGSQFPLLKAILCCFRRRPQS